MAAAMRSLLCRTLRPEDNAVVAVDYKGTGNALLRIGRIPFIRIHCRQVVRITVILLFVDLF